MNESLVKKTRQDPRVQSFQIGEIHARQAIPEKVTNVIVYCHGLGANKEWMARFYEKCYQQQIGIIAFDFPGHGEDQRHFEDFPFQQCLLDLKQVITYAKTIAPVHLFGSSFGGFVILNELLQSPEIESTFLMCPAVNFYSIVKRKLSIAKEEDLQDQDIYLYQKLKLSGSVYRELQEAERNVIQGKISHVTVVHGKEDKTVFYSDVEAFCVQHQIELIPVEQGKHELYDYDEMIVQYLVKSIVSIGS